MLAAGPLPPRADEHAASGVLKRRIKWLAAAESPSKTNGQKGMCPLPTSCGSRMIALSAVLLLRQPALDLRDREEPVRHIDLSGPMAVEIPSNGLDAVQAPFPNLPARQQIL